MLAQRSARSVRALRQCFRPSVDGVRDRKTGNVFRAGVIPQRPSPATPRECYGVTFNADGWRPLLLVRPLRADKAAILNGIAIEAEQPLVSGNRNSSRRSGLGRTPGRGLARPTSSARPATATSAALSASKPAR